MLDSNSGYLVPNSANDEFSNMTSSSILGKREIIFFRDRREIAVFIFSLFKRTQMNFVLNYIQFRGALKLWHRRTEPEPSSKAAP